MKYIVLVGDGMADYPLPQLGGRTPLEAAHTPHLDRIAACCRGLLVTIPPGMEPGSDVANLSLLGYDPKRYHTGRSPLEAASMGIALQQEEIAFRMNLVTLDRRSPEEMIMVSHSAGDISTPEAAAIVTDLKNQLIDPAIQIHQGVAYRHLLLWKKGPVDIKTLAPHDFLDKNMAFFLNAVANDPVTALIRRSWEILQEHPINQQRRRQGKLPADSIWLWGQGRAPQLPLFKAKYGLQGGVISAVDLIKGIGVYAGFKPFPVEGATGYLNTNYYGKAEAALMALHKGLDFMLLHLEAPDEAGHNGLVQEKIEAIENFDYKIVRPVLEGLADFEDFRIMVISDHFTPISLRTHSAEPTPFAWADKKQLATNSREPGFSEKNALQSGLLFKEGHAFMSQFLFGEC